MKLNTKNLLDVYVDSYGTESVAPRKLFSYYFNTIANHIDVEAIDGFGMYNHIKENQDIKIIQELTKENYHAYRNEKTIESMLCVLASKELLHINSTSMTYYYAKENKLSVKWLIEMAKKFPNKDLTENKVKMLMQGEYGYDFRDFKVNLPDMDISQTYNDDMIDFNDKIVNKLNDKNGKGLVFLYGKPGTGKTTYIRYLVSKIKKDIIYIPSVLVEALSSPTFIHLLAKQQGSVIIIEDAEAAIMSREHKNSDNDAVSTLLNLSDGLLADVLKIQIICTFNTNIMNIDKALLRASRLIGKYEFKELCPSKAQILSNDLGHKRTITEPLTVAEIFANETNKQYSFNNIKKIGFSVQAA